MADSLLVEMPFPLRRGSLTILDTIQVYDAFGRTRRCRLKERADGRSRLLLEHPLL